MGLFGGGASGPPGSKAAVVAAARDLRDEGGRWARRVMTAERTHRKLRQRLDAGGRIAVEPAEVAAAEEHARAVRADDTGVRTALADLERQLAECTETEAEWARRARVDAERVAAGLAGQPDPTDGAPGTAAGLRGLPPAILAAVAVWVLATGLLLVGALAGWF